jgi:hypothetical protein
MPLDEDGNLVRQTPHGSGSEPETTSIAPPGYGEHVLDQLYDEVDLTGLQTPGIQSGMNSPFYGHSRAGSTENLAAMMTSLPVPPAALTSRLQDMTLDASSRNQSSSSLSPGSGTTTPYGPPPPLESSHTSPPQSAPQSAPLSRSNSGEHSGHHTPEHIDYPELSELSKVPSYATAVKTPARPLSMADTAALPDYESAVSAPGSPHAYDTPVANPLESIRESTAETHSRPHRPSLGRRQTSLGISSLMHHHASPGDTDERRRLHIIQARERVI